MVFIAKYISACFYPQRDKEISTYSLHSPQFCVCASIFELSTKPMKSGSGGIFMALKDWVIFSREGRSLGNHTWAAGFSELKNWDFYSGQIQAGSEALVVNKNRVSTLSVMSGIVRNFVCQENLLNHRSLRKCQKF